MDPVMASIAPETEIDPSAWEVVTYYYLGNDPVQLAVYGYLFGYYPEVLNSFRPRVLRQCALCGRSDHFEHGALLQNLWTREYMVTGWMCALNLGVATESARRSAMAGQHLAYRRDWIAREIAKDTELRAGVWAKSEIIDDILLHAYESGDLTERMVQAIKNIALAIRRRDAWKEEEASKARVAAPTGRVEMEGTILGVKNQEGFYGNTVQKMLVEVDTPDGSFKVYGTVPDSLYDGNELKGRRIRFSATVEPTDDDQYFGFFKRPTRAVFTDGLPMEVW